MYTDQSQYKYITLIVLHAIDSLKFPIRNCFDFRFALNRAFRSLSTIPCDKSMFPYQNDDVDDLFADYSTFSFGIEWKLNDLQKINGKKN